MNLSGILLRPYVLRIPPFQRPYIWGVKEVTQLIDDLMAAFRRGAHYYFIGQIVFVKDGREYDISDGQQRLTTLTMILAHARDRLPQMAPLIQSLIIASSNIGRLRLKPGDREFYHQWVQTPGRFAEFCNVRDVTSDSQECMVVVAREIASELAADQVDERTLSDFIKYIARCAIFNVVDADEPGGAATVFETMNNRGQVLSGADILKGQLLARLNSNEEVQNAARIWEHLEDRAGRENFSRLLRYVPFLVRSGAIISPGDVAALIDTIATRIGVKDFLMKWLPIHGAAMLEIVHANVAAGTDSADINRRVRCLQLVEYEMWEPLAIAYLVKHPKDRRHARRFFLGYERFTAACLLNAVRTRDKKQRLERARTMLDDDNALAAAFELAPHMRNALREKISHSSNRDRFRRYIVMRVNAAFGEPLNFYDDVSVEHVLPDTPTAWWKQAFNFDDKTYREYANLLGNYVLITDRQNDEAENRPYNEKREIYFNRGCPERAITRDIKPIMEWTPRTLEERHERLVRMISQDWELARG